VSSTTRIVHGSVAKALVSPAATLTTNTGAMHAVPLGALLSSAVVVTVYETVGGCAVEAVLAVLAVSVARTVPVRLAALFFGTSATSTQAPGAAARTRRFGKASTSVPLMTLSIHLSCDVQHACCSMQNAACTPLHAARSIHVSCDTQHAPRRSTVVHVLVEIDFGIRWCALHARIIPAATRLGGVLRHSAQCTVGSASRIRA